MPDIGYTTVTPYLVADRAADAIEFYKKAFGAREQTRIENKDGTIGHAEIVIGNAVLMLSDEWLEQKVVSPRRQDGSSVSFVIMSDDADRDFKKAIDAGATEERPVKTEPYGRGGWLVDPFGHRWNIMTPNPSFTPEDMK